MSIVFLRQLGSSRPTSYWSWFSSFFRFIFLVQSSMAQARCFEVLRGPCTSSVRFPRYVANSHVKQSICDVFYNSVHSLFCCPASCVRLANVLLIFSLVSLEFWGCLWSKALIHWISCGYTTVRAHSQDLGGSVAGRLSKWRCENVPLAFYGILRAHRHSASAAAHAAAGYKAINQSTWRPSFIAFISV